MKTCHRINFVGMISILAWSAAVCSQPTGDKPKINVGDSWEFKTSSKTWSRTVVEAPAEDRLRVKSETGEISDYDGAMDFMPQGNPEFRRQLVAYPLAVGKEWSIARRFADPSSAENGNAKVVAFEQITVPAGTYQCYRIDADTTQNNRNNYSARRIWSRWYCPDVKWIAKEVLETRTVSRGNPAGSGITVDISELVRFTPGK